MDKLLHISFSLRGFGKYRIKLLGYFEGYTATHIFLCTIEIYNVENNVMTYNAIIGYVLMQSETIIIEQGVKFINKSETN